MASGKTWAVTASIAFLIACTSAGAGPLRAGGEVLTEGQITSNGTQRTYEMHRSKRLSGPSPLVIMLHGGGGNGKSGAMMTGFNALAEKEGFTVVYPDGSGRGPLLTWNAGHCCAWAMEQKVDDVHFLSDLIDDLVAKGIADPDRVYVTGMSNGAMMTYRAGRELSGKVAAIAPVVGAMFGDEAPAPAIPVLMVTGAKDTRVPAAGGNGAFPRRMGAPNDRPFAPAKDAFAYWIGSNDCRLEARPEKTGTYTLRQGRGCTAPVLWYDITDGGHAWPGGRKGGRKGDEPVRDFDASEVIWDFFSTQRLGG